MQIGDMCNRNVICAARDATVATAAKLMREHRVGDVIVVDRADAQRMPIGIVTDRDIVVKVVALGADPDTVTLGELTSWGQLATVQETDTLGDTIHLMHAKGVRRIPVINGTGVLVGIVSMDDMLPRSVAELSELVDLAARGRLGEETRTSAARNPEPREAK